MRRIRYRGNSHRSDYGAERLTRPSQMRRSGITLVEIIVAIVVLTLALVPLAGVLSSSNRVSNVSTFEIMAVHYAGELAEQLHRLSPSVIKQIRTATGQDLEALLEEPGLKGTLNSTSAQVEFQTNLPNTRFPLFLSPLHPSFVKRELEVGLLPAPPGGGLISTGKVWAVRINLGWKMTPTDPIDHGAVFSIILREDS